MITLEIKAAQICINNFNKELLRFHVHCCMFHINCCIKYNTKKKKKMLVKLKGLI